MPSYACPAERARLMARVCDRVARGLTLNQACESDPALPSRPTVLKWARQDEAFASRLRWAVDFGRGVKGDNLTNRRAYDPTVAERVLERVEAGEPLAAIVRAMFGRRVMEGWRRQRPDFDARLKAAIARAEDRRRRERALRRRLQARPTAYDEALADRIVLRVARGEPLPRVLADRTLPNKHDLRRWRRRHPEFDGALKIAHSAGHKARGRARCMCTPKLTEAICDRIRQGASLHSLSKQPDMPGLFALYKWVRTRPDFADAVRKACADREDGLADRIVEIAEASTPRTVRSDALRIAAIRQQMGRLRPYPGETWRKR